MLLTKDVILTVDDLPREKVPVPEWGSEANPDAYVFVRTMRAGERDRFEARHTQDRNADFRARLAASTVCDEAGELLFNDGDVPGLTRKSAAALDRIVEVAARLSKMTDQAVDELEKNSEATLPESSSSSSPAN